MFPELPLQPWMSFAYGSAVFKQARHSAESSLIDLMLIVEDAKEFHQAMLARYPEHYSWLARSFPRFIVPVQRSAGAVWFNTEVSLGPHFQRCKYGVISKDDALDDLCNWRSLYLAGRLHKPVQPLQSPSSEWEEAVMINRRAALAAALLLGGRDLWETIVGLSYHGDVRMGMAEAPGKIANIVSGQRDALIQIYREPLRELQTLGIISDNLQWDSENAAARSHLASLLPARFRSNLKYELERTVRWTSLGQTAKGLLTVPPGKALCYAVAKIRKRFIK